MIKTKTVFVLGAGASQPYGLPLGSDLYKLVIRDFSTNSQIRNEFFDATPFNQRHVDGFVKALEFSGLTSVDAFLEKRNEFINIGKAVMAIELLKCENHEVLWSAQDNWLKYLYARLMTDKFEEFQSNKVSFVTYNYDRTLENFLHTSLINSYGRNEEECKAALSHIGIVHLHGRLGHLPWQRDQSTIPFALKAVTPQVIEACQREIRIVHEDIEDRNVEFNVARRLLWEAKRIYFMGFGYAPQNVARLNFEEMKPEIAEGTALGLTQRERGVVRDELKGKVTLQDMNCLAFLRERGMWN